MDKGNERRQWIAEELEAAGLDALICSLPTNVLLVSGYWPVLGTAIAVTSRTGSTVVVPEDEEELARASWADVRPYQPGSLQQLTDPVAAIRQPLTTVMRDLNLHGVRLGYDNTDVFSESSYAAVHLFRSGMRSLLQEAAPQASVHPGRDVISRLRRRMTAEELEQVRAACEVAGSAFGAGRVALRPGIHEPQGAAAFQAPLGTLGLARDGVQRAGGFSWCMSGPHAALAGAAYARTRNRELQRGDLVMIHCNSYLDGFWTDITRTYCLGGPSAQQRDMFEAVFEARAAALDAIHPGARAAEVDAAARTVLSKRGFGKHFTHGLGHNVGFSSISGEFPPRLHPASEDTLEAGMTFNVEPAIYIEGYGGIRHCDVVTLHQEGLELLTPFAASLQELTVDS